MKLALTVLSLVLLATVAGASTVDFVGYPNYNVDSTFVSYQGLDFTMTGDHMYVWCCNSPNGNGLPGLIYADFTGGNTMTITKTGGGPFTLDSVDMTISFYDANASEVITANGIPLTLVQGLQTYNLDLSGVTSVVFTGVPSLSGYWFMTNVNYNSTTPEPGTLALLGSGALAGLGVLRRKMLL